MKTAKVLVADDNPFFRKVLEEQLSREGYEVWVAGNGHMAAKLAALLRPDLVIADEFMPGMTGIELCSRLRPPFGTGSGPFTIVATVSPESSDPHHAADFGVDLYMSKNDLLYLIEQNLLDENCLQRQQMAGDDDMPIVMLDENLAEPVKVAC